jgi:hypothetical protein
VEVCCYCVCTVDSAQKKRAKKSEKAKVRDGNSDGVDKESVAEQQDKLIDIKMLILYCDFTKIQ